MRNLLLLALLLLPACTKKPQEVRVLSFNLRYITAEDQGPRAWVARRDAAAATIQRDAPDFVGVQEALRPMLDDLKNRLPGYGEIGVGREDGQTKGEYAAILYRLDQWQPMASGTFWLSATPEVPGSATWGNRVTRICTWARLKHTQTGRELAVFNAHFDHQSQPAREQAADLILRQIQTLAGGLPVVLTGDLNATPDNPAILRLTTGPGALQDVWLAHHRDTPATSAGTYHGFSGNTAGPRIDYIFASPGIATRTAEILQQPTDGGHPPSDHFPVRATLQLR